MKYDHCYLPNGLEVRVSPIFGGFKFRVKDHEQFNCFPPEWTVSLQTKATTDEYVPATDSTLLPFSKPTLKSDALYLSSLSLPSCKDLKPSSATTRQIAMVLWVTFFWYFHEPDPNSRRSRADSRSSESRKSSGSSGSSVSSNSSAVPNLGDDDEHWILNIQQGGILYRNEQMMKIERLGLVASKDTSVGAKSAEEGFLEMFISQRAFWQLDPRVYLFSLSHVIPSPSQMCPEPACSLDSLGVGFPFGAGPNTAGTFLPSYYPPQPLQYVYTDGVRHPLRPKSYRQGEVFYVRYVPSGGQFLTFRVPVLPTRSAIERRRSSEGSTNCGIGPNLCLDTELANDLKLVYHWVQNRPPDAALSSENSIEEQSAFLEERLSSRNSFPVLVCWSSSSIGYFELFWVLEDPLGRELGDDVGEFDRGVRCFIGNEDFLRPIHLKRCMSSLVHHCWLYDQRTSTVMFEFRAWDHGIIDALQAIGFVHRTNIKNPGEHNLIMTIRRETWVAPAI